jgi:hypothetical protein
VSECPTLKVLISYAFHRDGDLGAKIRKATDLAGPKLRLRIFADSGAYTAFSQGFPLDVRAYGEWLHRWKHLFSAYANLDDKGSVATTLRNQAILESMGLRPIPVYHGGEPESVLTDYLQHYPYIALGGIAGGNHEKAMVRRFFRHAFELAAEKRAVYHAFGMTYVPLVLGFPWYSTDSTTWINGTRFGIVPVFDRATATMRNISLGNARKNVRLAALVSSYGVSIGKWSMRANNTRALRDLNAAMGAITYQRLESYHRRMHGLVPHRDAPGDEGLHLYLADSSLHHFAHLLQGLRANEPNLSGIALHGLL